MMTNRHASRIGQRIGKLMVVGECAARRNRYRVWRCRCDCGNEEDVPGYRLSAGARQVTACTACRAPTCRNCGQKMQRPTMARTCSDECRRALSNALARKSRSHLANLDPDYTASRVAYNANRLRCCPAAKEKKRQSDRENYRRRMSDPASATEIRVAKREREDIYRRDLAWRERQRLRARQQRRDKQLELLSIDLESIGSSDE